MGASQVEIVIRGTLSDALDDIIDGFHVDRVHASETHLIGRCPTMTPITTLMPVARTPLWSPSESRRD